MAPPLALQRGTGLVEALAACTVFAIALLGHSALTAQVNRHLQEARCRTDAVLIAQSLIGRMAADNPNTLALRYGRGGSGGSVAGGDAAFTQAVARLPGNALPGNESTIDIAPGSRQGSHRVAISIGWQLPGSREPHRHTTTTVFGGP